MDKSKIFAIVFFILIFLGIGIFILAKYLTESSDEEKLFDYLPKPDKDKNPDSSLIWINRSNEVNQSAWEDQLNNFMEKYTNSSYWVGSSKVCKFLNSQNATDDEYCFVDVEKIPYRTPEHKFGYTGGIGKPSVVLQLKNREGWVPEPYTSDAKDLEHAKELGMPQELLDRIKSFESETNLLIKRKMNTIWVTCEGVNPTDKENIGPIVFYSPGINEEFFPGIPGYYFPYLNQRGYMTPFVIAQFLQLQVNTLINVECKAWAKNIGAGDQKGFAKVEFEFLID